MRNVVVRKQHITYTMPILFILVLGALTNIVYAVATSQEEAEKIFNRHCNICHNGVTAVDFDHLLETLKSWAVKYPDIDTASRQEYGSENYDTLMKEMKRMTPTISDEEFKKLYGFFKAYFEEMKQTEAVQLTVTVTQTIIETATKTSPIYAHATVTVKEGTPDDTVKLISEASLVGVAIIAIAIILLVYRMKTR